MSDSNLHLYVEYVKCQADQGWCPRIGYTDLPRTSRTLERHGWVRKLGVTLEPPAAKVSACKYDPTIVPNAVCPWVKTCRTIVRR